MSLDISFVLHGARKLSQSLKRARSARQLVQGSYREVQPANHKDREIAIQAVVFQHYEQHLLKPNVTFLVIFRCTTP